MSNDVGLTASATAAGVPAGPGIALGSWAFAFGPFEAAPWSFEAFTAYTARAGYDGVEVNGFRPHPHDEDVSATGAGSLRDQLNVYGLGISGYAPDLRSTPPAEVSEAAYLARVASVSRFCTSQGIDTVRVDTITPSGGPGGDENAAYARLVRTWQKSAELLDDEGLRLVWEPEPGFWINRPSQVLKLVEDVDRPNFGLLFDTSHAHTLAVYGANQGPSPEILPGGAVEFAAMVAPFVRHLHLIDSDGSLHDDDTSNHLPFGRGEVDFPAVLDALGASAATLAWWTVDFCFWPGTVEDAAAAVPVVREMRENFLAHQDLKVNR